MTKKTKSEAVVAAAFASSRDVTVTPRTEKPNFDTILPDPLSKSVTWSELSTHLDGFNIKYLAPVTVTRLPVGPGVGTGEGRGVGAKTGAAVGWPGVVVGAGVGRTVGAGVGSSVGS